jgi:hypothetical protein
MVEAKLASDRGCIVDVGAPCDRRRIVGTRLATAALVVEDELVILGEVEHLRQQILVICAGSAVKDQ